MPLTPMTESETLAKVTQFLAPRVALDAIDVGSIILEATEDGVERPAIQLSAMGTHGAFIRVSCSVEMALRLLCAWVEAAGQTPLDDTSAERIAALRRAAAAVYAALRCRSTIREGQWRSRAVTVAGPGAAALRSVARAR